MTATASAPTNLKVNINDRDYDFSELPRTAQLVLQDMMRVDKKINELQFELRHLQAARQLYSSGVRKAMQDENMDQAEASEQEVDGHHG